VLATLKVSLGGSRNKAELGNPARWGLADVKLFGQVLLQYDSELGLLETNRDKEKQAIGEIKSNVLKGGLSYTPKSDQPIEFVCNSWNKARRDRAIQ
jgi:hypothetical protein